jgi:hypothetical protein
MSKLLITGNVALFEYEQCDVVPEFNYEDGILFVFGYQLMMAGRPIRSAKRYDFKLDGYNMLGDVKSLDSETKIHLEPLLKEFQTDNILVFTK